MLPDIHQNKNPYNIKKNNKKDITESSPVIEAKINDSKVIIDTGNNAVITNIKKKSGSKDSNVNVTNANSININININNNPHGHINNQIEKLNTIIEDEKETIVVNNSTNNQSIINKGLARDKSPKAKINDTSRGSSGRVRDHPMAEDGVHIIKKSISPGNGHNIAHNYSVKNTYDLPQLKPKQIDYNKKVKEVYDKNSRHIKMIPHVNNEHISNIYKIYAPYIKQSPVRYNKYSIDKKNTNGNYLKNLEKYYDYYNVYKPKKNSVESSSTGRNGGVIPNRKLSPIRKNMINL